MIVAKEEWCPFCNMMHPKYIGDCEGFKNFMKDKLYSGDGIFTGKEHSWVEEESDKVSTALVNNIGNQLSIPEHMLERVLKNQQRDLDTLCKKKFEEFYNNWYFYQNYKNKLKNSFPFKIKYVSL